MPLRFDAETLYNLLPAVYRLRDAALAEDPARGGPLRQFVAVLAEQALVVEESIYQLYDDEFIETCAEWVIPYIGDLIGARLIEMPDDDDVRFSRRAQVANTIATRRRKGTAAILEQIARDVMGVPARAVEFFQLVATTQHLNHIRLAHAVTPDLHDTLALEDVDSPFTTIPRTADVHRIQSRRGKYNLPNVGIFLWRLGVYPLTNIPAFVVDDRRFLFNPLGIDTQLFNLPEPEELITELAQPVHTPHPISRLRLRAALNTYYGRALTLFVDGAPVPASSVQVCNLADHPDGSGNWAHQPEDAIGIDPVLGRIHFPVNTPPPDQVAVTFHLPYVRPIGGGEYERDRYDPEEATIVPVDTLAELIAGIDQMRLSPPPSDGEPPGGVVEIVNSHTYPFNPGGGTTLEANAHLVIRAAQVKRPILQLAAQWEVQGAGDSRLTLDGLCITGAPIRVSGAVEEVTLRHCTLVPGLELARDGTPLHGDAPVLIIETSVPCRLIVEDSILGPVRVAEGGRVILSDSILDATTDDGIVYAAPGATPAERRPGGAFQMTNCTVRGACYTVEIEEASNCIFLAEAPASIPAVAAQRQQSGCIRFSYHPQAVRLPRRYRCVPEDLTTGTNDAPIFVSKQYGQPGYFQLEPQTPASIRRGAEDAEEMGAYHDGYQHLRERNLVYRLEEYLRFGLQVGIFYVS
ncbi:MAG: hypothetical protein Kow0077_22960 [Anaerolineae bacterium]